MGAEAANSDVLAALGRAYDDVLRQQGVPGTIPPLRLIEGGEG
jgi:hypothetical protein